jgi:tetratricopeptide (TPR) repeat protein
VDKSRNQLAMGRALHLKGDAAGSAEYARACYELAREAAPLLAVDALVLQGQVESGLGNRDAARDLFQRAIMTLTGIGADRHAAQLWFELGALLEGVGEHKQALDAYKRGAASTGLVPAADTRSTV